MGQHPALPPHSPDLNPSEKCRSKVMDILRSVGARTTESLYQALIQAFDLVILGYNEPVWESV